MRPTDLYRARKGKRHLSRNRTSRRNPYIAPCWCVSVAHVKVIGFALRIGGRCSAIQLEGLVAYQEAAVIPWLALLLLPRADHWDRKVAALAYFENSLVQPRILFERTSILGSLLFHSWPRMHLLYHPCHLSASASSGAHPVNSASQPQVPLLVCHCKSASLTLETLRANLGQC